MDGQTNEREYKRQERWAWYWILVVFVSIVPDAILKFLGLIPEIWITWDTYLIMAEVFVGVAFFAYIQRPLRKFEVEAIKKAIGESNHA